MAKGCSLFISTGGPVATDKYQKSLDRQERSIISTVEPVATGYQGYPGYLETPKDPGDSELESRIWPYHFSFSPDNVDHMEKVLSIIRKTYDRKPTDDEGSGSEQSYTEFFHVCHTSSCSSSWARLFAKPTIYQESTIEVCEAIISDN